MFVLSADANMRARPMTIDALIESPEQKPVARTLHEADIKESMFSSFAPPSGQMASDKRGQTSIDCEKCDSRRASGRTLRV